MLYKGTYKDREYRYRRVAAEARRVLRIVSSRYWRINFGGPQTQPFLSGLNRAVLSRFLSRINFLSHSRSSLVFEDPFLLILIQPLPLPFPLPLSPLSGSDPLRRPPPLPPCVTFFSLLATISRSKVRVYTLSNTIITLISTRLKFRIKITAELGVGGRLLLGSGSSPTESSREARVKAGQRRLSRGQTHRCVCVRFSS